MSYFIKKSTCLRNKSTSSMDFVLILCTRLVLEQLYLSYISPMYAYCGMTARYDKSFYLLSWLWLTLFAFQICRKHYTDKLTFSNTSLLLMFVIAFVPSTILMAYKPMNFWIQLILYWIAIFTFNEIIPQFHFSTQRVYLSDSIFSVLTSGLGAMVLYIWAVYADFHIQTSLVDVYGIRLEARTFDIPKIMAYLFAAAKAIFPLMTVWCLYMNKKRSAIVYIGFQYLTFCIDGSKSALFSLAIALITYELLKNKQKGIHFLIPAVFTLTLVSLFDCIIRMGKRSSVSDVVIRRAFFVPQILNYSYYDFFSTHSPDFFAQSFLRHFGICSQYEMNISYLIGKLYYNSPRMSANNGLFSDAYANFGFVGVIIMPLLIILLLRLLDACAEGLSPTLIITPVLIVSMALISSSFFTALLTHGILALGLIMLFLPRCATDENKYSKEKINDKVEKSCLI